MLTCRDVMTDELILCMPDVTVDQVAKLMQDGDVGAIPVVADKESGHLAGIVTDRDLALRVVGAGLDSKKTRVESVMSVDPHVCRVDAQIDEAIDIMVDEQIRRILVIDDDDRLVGIISQADIATRTDDPQQTAEVVEQISKANGSPLPAQL